jgi:hypothetical protein
VSEIRSGNKAGTRVASVRNGTCRGADAAARERARVMSAYGVDVERRADGVAWLILRNPDKLNAVRLEMWQAIPVALAELGADPAVRVVVLRGWGDAAFASGADISEFATHRKDAASAAAYEAVTATRSPRCSRARSRSSRCCRARASAAASRSRSAPTCASPPTTRRSRCPPPAWDWATTSPASSGS